MKKVSSIFLRSDIYPQDVENLIGWMDNPDVTMYLNEDHAQRQPSSHVQHASKRFFRQTQKQTPARHVKKISPCDMQGG